VNMKVIKVDKNGLYVEDVILKNGDDIPDDCIATPCQDGFYRPKWDGAKWVEGGVAPIPTPEQVIANLKAQLSETDYKIIKCSEYQLAGQELPYDIQELHTERQALRDQINELELALS
jgi:hypothetical protein